MSSGGYTCCLPANSTTWNRLLKVNDSGCLIGIGTVGTSQDVSKVKIEIGGNEVVKGPISFGHHETGDNGLSFRLPFDDKLEVYAMNQSSPSTKTKFWISCLIGPNSR